MLTQKKKNLNKKTKTISIHKNKQNKTKTRKNVGVKTMKGGFMPKFFQKFLRTSKVPKVAGTPNKGAFGQHELTKRPLPPIPPSPSISALEQTMMNVQKFAERRSKGNYTNEELQNYENKLRKARNLPKRFNQLPESANTGFRSIIASSNPNETYSTLSKIYPKNNAPPVPPKKSVNNLRQFLMNKSVNNLRILLTPPKNQ
jgi:hypothetical protein